MVTLIFLLYFIPLVLFISFELLCKSMGDASLCLNTEDMKDRFMLFRHNRLSLKFSLPFENRGKQQAIIIDGIMRVQPEGDAYNDMIIESKVFNRELPLYPDGYWEAFLVKPGKKVWVEGAVDISFKDGRTFGVKDIPREICFDLYYKYYGRTPLRGEKKEITVKISEFSEIEEEKFHFSPSVKVPDPGKRVPPQDIKTIPVKTHILRPHEDIIEILKNYALPLSSPGDIVAVAESVVAILQGRVIYIEDISPGYFATRISRFFKQDASLSSPYSLQMAIEEVGLWRIILAFLLGTGGKIIGRSGDFSRVAGRAAATIDDPPGTMPPFDKCVVLGPARPFKVAQYIKEKTGMDAVVVDANDLGRVDVLGSTLKDNHIIVKALAHNPQGNADEQTPIVLIRRL